MIRSLLNTAILVLLLIGNNTVFANMLEMTDDQLAAITATGFSVNKNPTGAIGFSFDELTQGGVPVSGTGTLEIVEAKESVDIGQLSLSDNAQQHLQSLINVNSVNSPVQVLLNLNVNINSVVESIAQSNQGSITR